MRASTAPGAERTRCSLLGRVAGWGGLEAEAVGSIEILGMLADSTASHASAV